MADSNTQGMSARTGLLAGCAVGFLFAVCLGVVGFAVAVRTSAAPPPPPPTPEEICRLAITKTAEVRGESLSFSELEEIIAECAQGYLDDPEARTLIDCLAEAPDGAATEACMDDPMALRSRRSEAPMNVDGIRTAEKAYHAEWDAFTTAGWTPPRLYGEDPGSFTGGGLDAFYNLGWMADGQIRCRYRTTAYNKASSAADDFVVEAECDIDGDGINAVYRANRAAKAAMVTPDDVY
ncbi:MAG: hypothetical protein GY898_07540 [Proteobacteria bacterium]|nr:hypothetical protein [Pseudomonadota bacterium]